jgi:hypothetical protein
MDKKVCQNPYCSGYKTDDRFIKVGGQKYLADRVSSSLRYQNGNFCTRVVLKSGLVFMAIGLLIS